MGKAWILTRRLPRVGLKCARPSVEEKRASPIPIGGGSQNAIFVEFTDASIEDFERQVENALSFLSQNQTEIADLVGARGVEEAYLDFCIPRIDVAAQSAVFPTRLVHAAGRLNLGLCLSLYEVS